MNFKKVFEIINQMEEEGVIERYAVGGAVGATFYLEPVATLDVDVFVAFRASGLIVDPSPIFEWLKAQGGVMEGEYVMLVNTPVQILMAGTPLVEEAILEAVEFDVEGVRVRVFSAEYLAAIALEVGRSKDKLRVLQFMEEEALDAASFEGILSRHGLLERWRSIQN